MPPDYLIGANAPFKLGSAEASGEALSPGESEERLWKTNVKGSCLYTEKDIDKLPPALLEAKVLPGAFITSVVQTLLGTKAGIEILGLEGYFILDEPDRPRPKGPPPMADSEKKYKPLTDEQKREYRSLMDSTWMKSMMRVTSIGF